jgi:hypothetical protein
VIFKLLIYPKKPAEAGFTRPVKGYLGACVIIAGNYSWFANM